MTTDSSFKCGLLRKAVGCAALLFVFAIATRAANQAALVGVVRDPDNLPLQDASVFVFSAKPRHGADTVTATAYPECGKVARTDAGGQFQIAGLNPDLIYRLHVVAAGHRPHFITNADPSGPALRAKLRLRKFPDMDVPDQIIGKVIDRAGKPVGGASVTLEFITKANGTRYGGGSNTSIDSSVATDENGEFLFNTVEPLDAIGVTIDGPHIAKHKIRLDRGKAHLIRVNEGITVVGRLRHDGAPLAGIKVAMSSEDRSAEIFQRGFEVATDRDGRFALQGVPAETRFLLYGKMTDLRNSGLSIPPQSVQGSRAGSKVDLGDLPLKPAYRIQGKVVLADNAPLPPRTRLYLSRENAWDTTDLILPPDGRFEFKAVPAESISLSVRIPTYRISARNPSKDWLNEGRLLGTLSGDLEDFIIHLERGERFAPGEQPPDSDRYPREKPLRPAKLP